MGERTEDDKLVEENMIHDEEAAPTLKKPTVAKDHVVENTAPPPPSRGESSHSSKVAKRLNEAVAAAKPVNRSADLVPLARDFDKMKKQLKSVIASAKAYHACMLSMDMARIQVANEFASMAKGSPIEGVLAGEDSSLVSTHQMALALGNSNAKIYQQEIIDYLVEWDKTVTDRVEVGAEKSQKLGKILDHYEIKVDGLRKKVTTMEKKGKTPSANLVAKLERNVEKLNEAWKNHERVASQHCNLLEEVVHRGWKDLYPVVKASMSFHQECAIGDNDVFAALTSVETKLSSIFNDKRKFDSVKEPSQVFVALSANGKPKKTSGSSPLEGTTEVLTRINDFPDLLPNDTSRTEDTHDQIIEEVSGEKPEDEVEEDVAVEIESKSDSKNDGQDEHSDDTPSARSIDKEQEMQEKVVDEAPPSPTGVIHGIPAVAEC